MQPKKAVNSGADLLGRREQSARTCTGLTTMRRSTSYVPLGGRQLMRSSGCESSRRPMHENSDQGFYLSHVCLAKVSRLLSSSETSGTSSSSRASIACQLPSWRRMSSPKTGDPRDHDVVDVDHRWPDRRHLVIGGHVAEPARWEPCGTSPAHGRLRRTRMPPRPSMLSCSRLGVRPGDEPDGTGSAAPVRMRRLFQRLSVL
jgi:hypothetical protein